MASNETVAEIVKEMRKVAHNVAIACKETRDRWRPAAFLSIISDRIAAAHDHELDVQYGRISRLVDKLAAKDAEIAELQRRLKEAEEFAAEMKESTNSLVRACGHQMILRLQGEGGNDEK